MAYYPDAHRHRVLIRLMDRRGRYPRESFLSEHAVFVVEEHCVYSAVHALPDDDYIDSELSWATMEEIRLWAVMALSCPEDKGFHSIHPSRIAISADPLDLPSWDLSDTDCCDAMSGLLATGASYLSRADYAPYVLHHHKAAHREQIRLLRSIEDCQHTEPGLVRGLVCLLKSSMLFDHWAFGEESALAVFTSMEAALSTVRNRLSAHRGEPVSFDDVHSSLGLHIRYGDALSEYFRDCWDKRIILAHPDNKFGAEPIPYLAADDFFDTYKALVSVYRLLLIGAQRPE